MSETIDAAFDGANGLAEVLARIAGLLARNLERSGFRDGCPVGTVCLEASAQSQVIQEACARHSRSGGLTWPAGWSAMRWSRLRRRSRRH